MLGRCAKRRDICLPRYAATKTGFCEKFGKALDYERESAPVRRQVHLLRRNSGLQNQAVIYRLNAAGEESVFIDPNTLSGDGTTSIAALSFSSQVIWRPIKK